MIKSDSSRIKDLFAATSRDECVVHSPPDHGGYCVNFVLTSNNFAKTRIYHEEHEEIEEIEEIEEKQGVIQLRVAE